ncbi:MAG: hypothetical protein V4556_07410 [Bacteroidota bacterium]
MKHNNLVSILAFITLLVSCKQSSIIGKWQIRRPLLDTNKMYLIINKDSTYKRVDANGIDTSKISGWNFSNSFGTWSKLNNHYLYLFPNELQDIVPEKFLSEHQKFGFKYKIIHLKKKKLVLKFITPGTRDTLNIIQEYKRI